MPDGPTTPESHNTSDHQSMMEGLYKTYQQGTDAGLEKSAREAYDYANRTLPRQGIDTKSLLEPTTTDEPKEPMPQTVKKGFVATLRRKLGL